MLLVGLPRNETTKSKIIISDPLVASMLSVYSGTVLVFGVLHSEGLKRIAERVGVDYIALFTGMPS